MASLDQLQKSGEPGVFYREHPTRKNGVRKDRQWIIRQTLGGKTRLSTLGWWSQGFSMGDAINKAHEYREHFKWNNDNPDQRPKPICKQDEDNAAAELAAQIERQKQKEQQENMSISQLWEDVYLPAAQQTKKPRTVGSEEALYKKWIEAPLGKKRITDLLPLDFSRLSKKIINSGRSPRTVHYVVSIILQMWNVAFDNKLVSVQPPRRKTLNLPSIDNERTRAFTLEEAQQFLAALQKRSQLWHDISLLSLLTGMRASEIYKLKLQDIDLERALLYLRTPKKSRSQHLQISDAANDHIQAMLTRRKKLLDDLEESKTDLLVFSKTGGQIKEVSDTVQRTIDDQGLNANVEKKDRLTFHSLRHTTATWLLEKGEDIYRVSKLLRHTTVRMTEQRYSHISNDTIKRTADGIGEMLKAKPKKVAKLKK